MDDETLNTSDRADQPPGHRWPPPAYWARSTLAVVSVLVVLAAVYKARSILLLVLISLILAIGLQRPLSFLERRGMRRGAALGVLVVGGILLFSGFLALVLPPVIRQGLALSERAPRYLDEL